MNDINASTFDMGEKPVVIPIEAYVSADYARAEGDKLWPKVWQAACRVEEIPKIGDYVTYNILDESIIVVRTAIDKIQAFYNVCLHRGRRLTQGCGHTAQFYCRFHGWRWDLNGESAFVLAPEDWGGALNADNLRMKQVQCDSWGGWIWVNMDPGCEPLLDYLKPASPMLDPFELDKMRYRWRQWLYFPCNWKTAMEAFIESYHVAASHPQLLRGGPGARFWSRAQGRHAWHGSSGPRGGDSKPMMGLAEARGESGQEAPVAVANDLAMLWNTLNATTTETFVKAAKRLAQELPPGTSLAEVGGRLMAAAKQDDADRGVIWPEIDPAHMAAAGIDWHVFPNSIILPSITTALCYRARPNGYDPNSCIFEVCVLERFPDGEEPKTEWVYQADASAENWRLILSQDFQNMPEVQKGMKSRGFPGARPNPVEEIPVVHFHRNLAAYMGTGAPRPIWNRASG